MANSLIISEKLGVAHDKLTVLVESLNSVYQRKGLPLILLNGDGKTYEVDKDQYTDIYSVVNLDRNVTINREWSEFKISKTPLFFKKMEYKNEYDLVKKIVFMYASIINANKDHFYITKREIDVLAFFVLYGYSEETKQMVSESLDMNIKNLEFFIRKIMNKKLMYSDRYKTRLRYVSDDLIDFVKNVREGVNNGVVIKFNKV